MTTQTVRIGKDIVWTVTQTCTLDAIRELAEKDHWVEPEVIRKGGMIDSPLVTEKWRYEPLIDDSTLPSGARKRIEMIKSTNPVGFIIGHEIETETPVKPKIKPLPWIVAPEPEKPARQPYISPQREIDWGRVAIKSLKVLGMVLLGVLYALAIAASIFAQVDPVVIVVTEAGEWVVIYRYYL